jgi:hypothetical protein
MRGQTKLFKSVGVPTTCPVVTSGHSENRDSLLSQKANWISSRCSRGSGYRRLSQREKIKYLGHVTMWRQMQKVGQQTLDAFFDLGDLYFSGIIIIDERWISMGINSESIFDFIQLP